MAVVYVKKTTVDSSVILMYVWKITIVYWFLRRTESKSGDINTGMVV